MDSSWKASESSRIGFPSAVPRSPDPRHNHAQPGPGCRSATSSNPRATPKSRQVAAVLSAWKAGSRVIALKSHTVWYGARPTDRTTPGLLWLLWAFSSRWDSESAVCRAPIAPLSAHGACYSPILKSGCPVVATIAPRCTTSRHTVVAH